MKALAELNNRQPMGECRGKQSRPESSPESQDVDVANSRRGTSWG